MATPTLDGVNKPTRLVSHFCGRASENHGVGWSDLWDKDESHLWDRGKPSPPLIDFVEQRSDLVNSRTSDGRRKKALVPGCGRGYDVVMLALHGFDAYGLEISATAVATAEAYATSEMGQPSAYNFSSTANGTQETAGPFTFLHGDFFHSDWEDGVTGRNVSFKFDLIYDYTFLCALPPNLRTSWVKRIADLLNPDGLLICLEFPLYKDRSLPGPPWGLNGVYWDLLARGRNGILEDSASAEGECDGNFSSDGKFERKLYYRPEKSYEMGRGTDMLSVWTKK